MMLEALTSDSASLAGVTMPVPMPAAGFAARLQSAQERIETAQTAAEQLVAQTLVMPILSSMREGPFLDGPFKPGTMERRFAPMLDRYMSEAITTSSSFGLVDSVVDQLLGAGFREGLEVTA